MSSSEVGRKFTFWVVYDTTGDRQFVKMDSDTGCLAMFDNEESAAAFASGLAGVGYKEVVLYQQPPDAVGWQFYQDGKWWNGDDRIKDHRRNTQEAGFRVRDVYATQQPECGCCGQTDKCDDDCDAVVIGGHRGAAEPQLDVAQLVETLESLIKGYVGLLEAGADRITSLGGDCDPVPVMEQNDPLLRDARAVLAAHHKQGGDDERREEDLRRWVIHLANSRDPRFMKIMQERVDWITPRYDYDEALAEVLAAFWLHQPPSSWVRDELIPDDFVLSEAKKILPY